MHFVFISRMYLRHPTIFTSHKVQQVFLKTHCKIDMPIKIWKRVSITVDSVTQSLQKISVTKLYGMKIKQRPHNEPEHDVVVLFKSLSWYHITDFLARDPAIPELGLVGADPPPPETSSCGEMQCT